MFRRLPEAGAATLRFTIDGRPATARPTPRILDPDADGPSQHDAG